MAHKFEMTFFVALGLQDLDHLLHLLSLLVQLLAKLTLHLVLVIIVSGVNALQFLTREKGILRLRLKLLQKLPLIAFHLTGKFPLWTVRHGR